LCKGFVTGHDFSRAENAAKSTLGFSPCKIFFHAAPKSKPFSAASLAPEESHLVYTITESAPVRISAYSFFRRALPIFRSTIAVAVAVGMREIAKGFPRGVEAGKASFKALPTFHTLAFPRLFSPLS
jgi:hypothetical protein